MRMWNVGVKGMCRQHLLGEHLETHMFVSHINRNKGVTGFIKNNLLEPMALESRHKELAKEMIRRGYNHHSELPEVHLDKIPQEYRFRKIRVKDSTKDLVSRCFLCRSGYLLFNSRLVNCNY